jgi:hypothetical protein
MPSHGPRLQVYRHGGLVEAQLLLGKRLQRVPARELQQEVVGGRFSFTLAHAHPDQNPSCASDAEIFAFPSAVRRILSRHQDVPLLRIRVGMSHLSRA